MTPTTADTPAGPPQGLEAHDYLRKSGWRRGEYGLWHDPDGGTLYRLDAAAARQWRRDAAIPTRPLYADLLERALWVPGDVARTTFFLLPVAAAPPGLLERLGLAEGEYYPDAVRPGPPLPCLVLGSGEPARSEKGDMRWLPFDSYEVEGIRKWTLLLGDEARRVVDVAGMKRRAQEENARDAARQDRERRELREHEQQLVVESQRRNNPLFRVKEAEQRAAAVEARLAEVERQRAAEAEARVRALEKSLEEKLAKLEGGARPDAPPPA
jgi:hypothetical protein